jgi:hypothetical protein
MFPASASFRGEGPLANLLRRGATRVDGGRRPLDNEGKEWTLTVAIRDDASPNVAGQDRSGCPRGRSYWADCRVRSALATSSSRFRNSQTNQPPHLRPLSATSPAGESTGLRPASLGWGRGYAERDFCRCSTQPPKTRLRQRSSIVARRAASALIRSRSVRSRCS